MPYAEKSSSVEKAGYIYKEEEFNNSGELVYCVVSGDNQAIITEWMSNVYFINDQEQTSHSKPDFLKLHISI